MPIALRLVRQHTAQLHSQRPEFKSRLVVLCWSRSTLSSPKAFYSTLSCPIKGIKSTSINQKKKTITKLHWIYREGLLKPRWIRVIVWLSPQNFKPTNEDDNIIWIHTVARIWQMLRFGCAGRRNVIRKGLSQCCYCYNFLVIDIRLKFYKM